MISLLYVYVNLILSIHVLNILQYCTIYNHYYLHTI